MKITIEIQSGFDQDNYANLKKMLDAYVDEIIKADPFRSYPQNKNRMNFSVTFQTDEEVQPCAL